MTRESYYARRQNFVEGAFIVLKLATQLKSLFMHHYSHDSYAQMDILSECMHDVYPFGLKSLSTQTFNGTSDFLGQQTQLERLVLFPSHIKRINRLALTTASIALPQLRTLWATSWWGSLILPQSPIRTFGLLYAGANELQEKEDTTWRTVFRNLAESGGHAFVNSLVLPYEGLFWDHGPQVLDQELYGKAFPRVTKLCIIPHGLGTGRV
ncbi:hypothetical protein FRC07_005766, partial [Ceratobasidium sp. 392]